MPQMIYKSGGGAGKPDDKPAKVKKGRDIKFSGDISELPKPLLIGIGVLALVFVLFMYDRYVGRIHPVIGANSDKVTPPPGYPDIPPYNSKSWQKSGMRAMSGMPPPAAIQRMGGVKSMGGN